MSASRTDRKRSCEEEAFYSPFPAKREEARSTELPRRKPLRLPNYDYSAPGAYFVTICTHDRRCILSDITVGEGLAPPGVTLTSIGQIVEEQIKALPGRYPAIEIENHVIMPNHIHALVSIRNLSGGASPSPTAGSEASSSEGGVPPSLLDVVRVLKSLTTRMARPFLGESPLWQRSCHKHVIRNEEDYRQIWEYIDANPAKLAEDRSYRENRE